MPIYGKVGKYVTNNCRRTHGYFDEVHLRFYGLQGILRRKYRREPSLEITMAIKVFHLCHLAIRMFPIEVRPESKAETCRCSLMLKPDVSLPQIRPNFFEKKRLISSSRSSVVDKDQLACYR
ncbi:hypothetical protein AVEN_90826-1 [Araneus ventricosus]|uniref:Uncharacterized protein n=1 Tax=Araneus ventricosus TaxID=182803 RepID=A0A4Y2QCV9_ARAVE|nr:hypothetical protein AVEN_90826-1 [Araneus ventricosus]